MAYDFELFKAYPVIPGTSLKLPIARKLFDASLKNNRVNLLECRGNEDAELLILQVEVQTPQDSPLIERYEDIGILCKKDSEACPEVFSMRENFPIVPHLNLRSYALPKSLCIYEQNFDEMKLVWSAASFIEDTRDWLSRTAKGILHQHDQILEPLLSGDEGAIFFLPGSWGVERLAAVTLSQIDGKSYVLSLPEVMLGNYPGDKYEVICAEGKNALIQGVITQSPKDVAMLQNFLVVADIDIKEAIFSRLTSLINENATANLSRKLLLLISIPKQRKPGSEVVQDYYCFITKDSIRDIGVAIGLFDNQQQNFGLVIGARSSNLQFEMMPISMMNPTVILDAQGAREYNGIATYPDPEPSFFAIGLGALGSHIFQNLSRSGYGKWSLVDPDVLFPHNLARHTAYQNAIGKHKAAVVSLMANQLLNDATFSTPIADNALRPKQGQLFDQRLQESNVILDMSASLAVGRHVATANEYKGKRIVSAFLNPTGNALVMIIQDAKATIPVDALEMQYYGYILRTPSLAKHLHIPEVNGIRYSNSCRDITGRISQDSVSIFSGLGSAKIKQLATKSEAEVVIWEINDELAITKHNLEVATIYERKVDDWTIYYDQLFLNRIMQKRSEILPSETGGILLGVVDLQRSRIYVVDSILSPEDSKEYPNAYIRGIAGVEEEINAVRDKTARMVRYIGEWHSHPEGASLNMSGDDKNLLAWLKDHQNKDGLPGLILIAGNSNLEIYISE